MVETVVVANTQHELTQLLLSVNVACCTIDDIGLIGDHMQTCSTPAGGCLGCAIPASGRNSPDLDAPSAAGLVRCQVNVLVLHLACWKEGKESCTLLDIMMGASVPCSSWRPTDEQHTRL